MKLLLSILLFLVAFNKVYAQLARYRCDSLIIENHYEEPHWSYPHYTSPNYNNIYAYYDLDLINGQGKYENDTSTFYYFNNTKCPIPINATSLTISLDY